MSLKNAARVSHVEFRISGEPNALWFGLYAPESAKPDAALFAGEVPATMPRQLRALADLIEAKSSTKREDNE